jgi:hypothetical protein
VQQAPQAGRHWKLMVDGILPAGAAPPQPAHGLLARGPAHGFVGGKVLAHLRALRPAVQLAAPLRIEMDAGHASRLPAGHAGDGAGYRRRRAAGAAVGAARDRSAVHVALL